MKTSNNLSHYINLYFKQKPFFIGLIRAKELTLYEKHLPRNVKNQSILDFGFGDGFFLDLLLRHTTQATNNSITGLDLETLPDDIFTEAEQRNIYDRLILYNGKETLFSDKKFDIIISNCVLEHVRHLEKNMSELYRILKPGGTFYCTVMTNKWEQYLLGGKLLSEPYKQWMRGIQNHPNLLSHNEWKELFTQTGFIIKNIEGYFDAKTSQYMEILHYISIPSLISYKLMNDWVPWRILYDIIPLDRLFAHMIKNNPIPEQSAALFLKVSKEDQ